MNNFQVIANVNVTKLTDALDAHPELWNTFDLRSTHPHSPHKEADDIWIRFNRLDQPTRKLVDDKECYWYPASDILPVEEFIYQLLIAVKGDQIGRAIITRLKPGAEVKEHEDKGAPAEYYQRFHICLQNAPGAVFKCNGESFTPSVGDVYWFNNVESHSVHNNSDQDRITLIVDIRTPMMEHLKETIKPVMQVPSEQRVYPEGISYQVEKLDGLVPELLPFVPLHWAELGLTQDEVPVDMDWDRYLDLEDRGQLHLVTARDNGVIIGYHFTFVGGHYHYKSTLHGMVDLYFILPEYRKNKVGVGMFKFAEEALKNIGVVKIITGTKLHLPHDKLFVSLGYTASDTTFYKLTGA